MSKRNIETLGFLRYQLSFDLNSALKTGSYFTPSGALNTPGKSFHYFVDVKNWSDQNAEIIQTAIASDTTDRHRRTYLDGKWSDWELMN